MLQHIALKGNLEKVTIANALQLEAARRRASRSWLFLAKFVLRMRTNCCIPPADDLANFLRRHVTLSP